MTTMLTAPTAPSKPRLRRMRYEPEPGEADDTPPCPVRAEPPPVNPEPAGPDDAAVRHALVGVLRHAMEVLDGRRPHAQLSRHFEPPAQRYWRAATLQRQVRSPARIGRMVLCLPRPDAAEVAATCEIDGRVRALAARFERADPGATWRCTALRLG